MFTGFEQLRLRTKLVFGFGTVISLMLLGSCVAMAGHERTMAAVEAFLVGDKRIADLSLQSSAGMGNARRFEKEFLLKRQLYSYGEAKSRYVTLVSDELASVREDMEAIRQISGNAGMTAQTLTIEKLTYRYEQGFLRAVELYGRLGRGDSGQEGQFQRAAQDIDALAAGHAPLRIDLLSLRGHEKNFVMNNATRNVLAFDAGIGDFRRHVQQAALAPSRTLALLAAIDRYASRFHAYAATLAQIDAAAQDYLMAVHAIEPQLAQLHLQADNAVAGTRGTMRDVGRVSAMAIAGAGIAAVLLGIAVAGFIVRSAGRAISACLQFAGSLAAGDWSARLPAKAGANEFAILARALNAMADVMQSTHGREAGNRAELLRLNRTLRMLARCSETQAAASREAELLHAICRQIVEVGGYPVAWATLAGDDSGHEIELAACALIVKGKLVQDSLAWSDDVLQRSAPSAAMRERNTILLRDIALPSAYAGGGGGASCIALPLRNKELLLGALCIYSSELNAFSDEEVLLLQKLSEDLALGMVGLRDAVRREEAERALAYQASHDALTGLANRMLFCDRLQQATHHAARNGQTLAVMVLGLDRYKELMEGLGHDTGNALLRHVGNALPTALRVCDMVARLSDDTFAVAITELKTPEEAMPVALKLLAGAMAPFELGADQLGNGVSIGISVYPRDGDDVNQLLRNATAAMSSAQARGGKQCRFYAPEMNLRVGAMFALETELRHAISHGELRAYYQPKVNLASGEIIGAEALVRWQHPQRDMIPPSEFIPLAESSGLILPLGEWMIKQVCRQQRAWLDAGIQVPAVAVNLSALQFRQKDLVGMIRHELDVNRLDGSHLEMEITESALMDDLDEAVQVLRSLKSMGIKLSLDDFGTGHSSLSRLRHLPIDHVKIDQSFVRNLTVDPGDAAICIAIVDLAHTLHMSVIAEGVETEGQAIYLREHHCDDIQGYFFSRPVAAADYARLLVENTTLDLPRQAPDGRRTVLLVDDEPNILAALKRSLRRDGYRILSANGAREGLELLATHQIQVILSDQRMPDMSGTEFLARVRELYPETVRIILSGYTDLSTVTEAVNRGAIYKFLTKPWEDDALRAHVRAAFNQREPADEKIAA
jgi:diguanylate cyclase (GGDEF)-like protein